MIKNAYRADVNPIMEQTVDTFHTTNSTDLLITDRIIGKRERKRERESGTKTFNKEKNTERRKKYRENNNAFVEWTG